MITRATCEGRGARTSARPARRARPSTAATGAPRRLAVLLLAAYKRCISPLLPPACRYFPTCSEYASEAVSRFGVLRGGWLSVRRLSRCHPLGKGGFDPVPPLDDPAGGARGDAVRES